MKDDWNENQGSLVIWSSRGDPRSGSNSPISGSRYLLLLIGLFETLVEFPKEIFDVR